VRFSPPAPAVWRSTRHAPPRHPHPGVAGGPAGKARNQLTVTSSRPSTSPGSPTWASVVRGEAREGIPACSGSQPAALSVAEFSALYEHCVASGLKASISFRHAAGVQVITVTCNVPVPAATDTAAGRRRWRRRRKEGVGALPPLRVRNRCRRHRQPLSPQSLLPALHRRLDHGRPLLHLHLPHPRLNHHLQKGRDDAATSWNSFGTQRTTTRSSFRRCRHPARLSLPRLRHHLPGT
jgi:hypothetical protein